MPLTALSTTRRRVACTWLFATLLITWPVDSSGGQSTAVAAPQDQQAQAPEAPLSEPAVVITADRREELLINAPATMSVITEEAIGNAPSQSMTELMRLVPGVNITQASARDINITIRGATGTLEDSTLVLLDGRSIYQDFFGFVMWDFVPVDPLQIKQIEIVRGPASAVWGANALRGVVNVITKTPRELAGASGNTSGTSLSIQFGHFDRSRRGEAYDGGGLFSINATHAEAPSDRFAFKISAGVLAQESFLRPAGNVRGTQAPYPPFENSGTTQPKLDARADYNFADRHALILAGGIGGTEGILHTGLGPLDIRRGSTFKYGRVTYQREQLRLQMFVNALDGEGGFLFQRGTDGQIIEPTFENQVYDVEFSNVNVFRNRHVISYGGNFRHNRFDLSVVPRAARRNERGAYIQDTMILSERLRWIVGGRSDSFGNLGKTVFSPRTALIVHSRPTNLQGQVARPVHTVRFSVNRAFRAPSLFNNAANMTFVTQVAAGAGSFPLSSTLQGNVELSPEELTAYEVAYSNRVLSAMTVGVAAYVNRTRNMIMFTQTGTYTSANPPPGWPIAPAALDALVAAGQGLPAEYSYRNFDKVTDRGVELSLDARVNATVNTFINYTWQDASRPEGFGSSELNIPPRHRVNAGASITRGRYFGSVSASFQDEAFWQDVLDARYHGWTSPYTVVNAGAGVRSTDGTMTVAIRATNVFNRTLQQHIFGDLIKRGVIGEVRFLF
jgi:iron complex outermembrane receptor protein